MELAPSPEKSAAESRRALLGFSLSHLNGWRESEPSTVTEACLSTQQIWSRLCSCCLSLESIRVLD